MRFIDFQRKAYLEGLYVRIRNQGIHWQIRGGAFLVNYYPTKRTIFVKGMAESFKGDHEEAMRIARNGPPVKPKAATRRKSYRDEKQRLLRKSNLCHWCGLVLTSDTATVDHLIPLGRGGSDRRDNLVLACEPCNAGRGCTVQPPPSKAVTP